MQPATVIPDIVPAPAVAPGAADFRRINRAMMFGGFSTFALLYCIQPLMPMLAHEFVLTAAQSSLALSLSTGMLAVSLIVSSLLSERFGRKPMMAASMTLGGILTVLCAFAQTYPQLLVLRGLLGFMLGGMPAIAMAYLSEEIDPRALGLSMGLYISGSAFGGMLGRMATSLVSDFYNWRLALGLMGAAGLYAAWEFWRSLPASKNFRPGSRGVAGLVRGARHHFADAGLPWLFVLAFLLMGAFVSLYNYIGYRMLGAPFALRPGVVGLLSLLYLLGIVSAVWAGRLADRLGRRNVLWLVMGAMLCGLLLTLINFLPTIVLGMGLFTFGFFASHSVASSWVGRRARAPQALASALYLFFYYLGSSVVGWVAGVAWEWGGWPGVVMVLGGALGLALLIALKLRTLAPLEPAAIVAAEA